MVKMIVQHGDLLKNVSSGHIVSGCNAQGVMGSGFALAIKKMYPGAYVRYHDEYKTFGLTLGVAYEWKDLNNPESNLVIWNAITQQYFGLPGRNCSYDAIQACFEQINQDIPKWKYVPQEIHIPMIGAGLGGGNWEIIKTIIEQTVDYPTTVWVL
jgi:O-acetyl-ADP-ribose deacetylase (regulator of RNase III)